MSHFQIGLAVVGGLMLAAMVAWNLWWLYRSNPRPPPKKVQGSAEQGHDSRRDPGLSVAGDASIEAAPSVFSASIAPPERGGGLDASVDAIVPLTLVASVHAVPGAVACHAMPRMSYHPASKPISIEGLNQSSGQWERPQAGQFYSAFQAGIQLANQTGALTEPVFSEFVTKVQEFAVAIAAIPQFPDMAEQLVRARELECFIKDHNVQLVFWIYARKAAWTADYVHQHAGWQGFVTADIRQPRRLVLSIPNSTNSGTTPLLWLNYDLQTVAVPGLEQSLAVHQFTLTLDVAHVQREIHPFERLCTIATTLCQELDGVLCDQEGMPLSSEMLQTINEDVEKLYQHNLPAGAALTQRLFN